MFFSRSQRLSRPNSPIALLLLTCWINRLAAETTGTPETLTTPTTTPTPTTTTRTTIKDIERIVLAAVESSDALLECPIDYVGSESSWTRIPTKKIVDEIRQWQRFQSRSRDRSGRKPPASSTPEVLTSDLSVTTTRFPARYSILSSSKTYSLRMRAVTFWDAGVYECRRGNRTRFVELLVVGRPKCHRGRNVVEGSSKKLAALCEAEYSALDETEGAPSTLRRQPFVTLTPEGGANWTASGAESKSFFASTGDSGVTHQVWMQRRMETSARGKTTEATSVRCSLDFPRWAKGQYPPSCWLDFHDFPIHARAALVNREILKGKAHQVHRFVDVVAFEGTTLVMDCNISNPHMWQRKTKTRGWDDLFIDDALVADSDLPPSKFHILHLPVHNLYRLTIPVASFNDAGVYTCMAATTPGRPTDAAHATVAIYNVMVVGKPQCHLPYNATQRLMDVARLGRTMRNSYLRMGLVPEEMEEAKCSVRYEQVESWLTKPLISWHRGTDVYYEGITTDVDGELDVAFRIRPKDVGFRDLECVVEHRSLVPYPSDQRHNSCSIPLSRQRFAPVVEERLGLLRRAGEVELTCVAVGNPLPKIDWRIDGVGRAEGVHLLTDSFDGSQITSRLRLTASAVASAHGDTVTFSCHAANALGRDVQDIRVDFREKPSSSSFTFSSSSSWYWLAGGVSAAALLAAVAAVAFCCRARSRTRRADDDAGNYDKMDESIVVRAPDEEGGRVPEMEWDHL